MFKISVIQNGLFFRIWLHINDKIFFLLKERSNVKTFYWLRWLSSSYSQFTIGTFPYISNLRVIICLQFCVTIVFLSILSPTGFSDNDVYGVLDKGRLIKIEWMKLTCSVIAQCLWDPLLQFPVCSWIPYQLWSHWRYLVSTV